MPSPQKIKSNQAWALQKLSPKLRVIANGSDTVNAARSEQCPFLRISGTGAAVENVKAQFTQEAVEQRIWEKPAREVEKYKKLAKKSSNVSAQVFVHLSHLHAKPKSLKKFHVTARRGRILTLEVPAGDLKAAADDPDILYIEPGQALATPTPILGEATAREPSRHARAVEGKVSLGSSAKTIEMESLHRYGEDVIVGVIDVQGFDFSHPDFASEDGGTRFEMIWDQGGEGTRPAPSKSPDNPHASMKGGGKPYSYGALLTKKHMNAAIRNSKARKLPAYELEPQSQMASSSHGTHVASIVCGNLGVARKATLAAVLLALPKEDLEDSRRSFYDSTRLVHAVEFLLDYAAAKKKPIVINISLGTNGHAHDGSAPVCRWIDSATTEPGRVICAAAGNAGQEKSSKPGDLGYVMGRIHTHGRIPARGLIKDIEWQVIGDGREDISENELEIWYGSQDRFQVSLRLPDGQWIEPVRPGEFVENRMLDDGTRISIYNELYNAANGSNYISIHLSPYLSKQVIKGVKPGMWVVRLEGIEVRNGRYHGWIERDDPRKWQPIGNRPIWSFPSYFSELSNVDDSSVGSLGCGQRIICVANLDSTGDRIHITSSQGPTRDGREKPDVAAPGTDIKAARGFDDPAQPWVEMTGTSMACPYVAGVVALMLATNPVLTAAQVESIVRNTARPLPGSDYAWRNDAGYGVIDPVRCVAEAENMKTKKDIT